MAIPFYLRLQTIWKGRLVLIGRSQISSLPLPNGLPNVLEIPSSVKRSLKAVWRFTKTLHEAEGPFSASLCLPTSFSASFLMFLCGGEDCYGFSHRGNEIFFTDSIAWGDRFDTRHKSVRYQSLLRLLCPSYRMADGLPSLPSLVGNDQERERLIVVAPLASHPLRVWPYFPELIKQLSERLHDYEIVIIGKGDGNGAWHRTLKRLHIARIKNLIDKTSLLEVQVLLQRACLLIANDSGIAHLASLTSTKSIVLFGPGSPNYVRPISRKAIVLRNKSLPCSPCEKTQCDLEFGYQTCLRSLSAEMVFDQVYRSLDEHTPVPDTLNP